MLNMKKLLLLLLTAVFAVTAMAQTSIETALDLQEGANSHDYDGSPVYWKYTPPTGQGDRLLLISADGSTSITVTDEGPDGTTTMYGAQMAYPQKAYIAYEGHTLYISAQVYNGTSVGFTASFDENAHIGGLSQDDPLAIVTDGSNMVFGDMYSSNMSYSYATYTADSDGVLVMSASGYVSYSVEGGASGSFQYTNGSYSASLTVRSGQKYNITFSGYGAFVLTAEMTHPTEGSLEMPFEIQEGDNTVPARFGEYWYTYTNTKTGYGVISSDNTLSGGSIKVYSSTYDITYGNVYAQVIDGYNLRFEMPSVGTTYYICITKVEASATDETFTFTAEDYQPGDLESNPIVIEQLPATGISTEAVGGTKYYAVNVPAGDHKLLNVEAQSEITNTATSVAVYVQGNSYNATSGNASVRAEVNGGTSGQRYIIRWTSQETQPIEFTVSLEDIKKGDLISNPIEAVLGPNKIDADGTRYYTYTPTKNCKLVLTTPKIETTASFSVYSYGYSPVTASNSGNVYSLSVTEGTQYYIQLSNAAVGEEFTLAEAEFEQGETRDKPIIVEDGTFILGTEVYGDYWLQYTVEKDGVLVITCDVPFNTTDQVLYGKASDSYLSLIGQITLEDEEDKTIYGVETSVSAGDVYLVNLKLKSQYAGNKVTFTVRDPEVGETIDNPITLVPGQAVEIPAPSRTKPVWCKATLSEGDVKIESNYSLTGMFFEGEEAAKNNNGTYIYFYDWDPSDYTPLDFYTWTSSIVNAGDYYFKFEQGSAGTTLTLSGTATSIDNVAAEGTAISLDGNTLNINVDNADVRVYTLSGAAVVSEKVSGNASFSLDKGIYIVKINNTVKKVIVR